MQFSRSLRLVHDRQALLLVQLAPVARSIGNFDGHHQVAIARWQFGTEQPGVLSPVVVSISSCTLWPARFSNFVCMRWVRCVSG
mmetsp:Transcript_10769/g.12426  ORF Transcript_10769/g.12426 Transcript_10769/m.12426 type:complete len:84 (-) Transcript_10769:18-269(-)